MTAINPGIKKITSMDSYSSNTVPKISQDEFKTKILDLGLID